MSSFMSTIKDTPTLVVNVMWVNYNIAFRSQHSQLYQDHSQHSQLYQDLIHFSRANLDSSPCKLSILYVEWHCDQVVKAFDCRPKGPRFKSNLLLHKLFLQTNGELRHLDLLHTSQLPFTNQLIPPDSGAARWQLFSRMLPVSGLLLSYFEEKAWHQGSTQPTAEWITDLKSNKSSHLRWDGRIWHMRIHKVTWNM